MRSPKRLNIVAAILIVLGVAATLGGVYGRVFLAEDEGHHDDREPTFALESQVGIDELAVTAVGPNEIQVEILRAGQARAVSGAHGESAQLFVVGADRQYFDRSALSNDDLATTVTSPSGRVRAIVYGSSTGGSDFLELGATVDVGGEPLPDQNITDGDRWTNDSITVTRQGFDFVLSEPWNGDEVSDGPAFLTLVRAEDFAFTHAHAELVGDNRFSFATDLPGLGDYLAALEFEQDGETVTALFRFTL